MGAASFPLGAAVGSGTENHPQPLLLRHAAELRDVGASVPLEDAPLAFVEVPEHVAPDGVASHRPQHPEAVLPVIARNARVVNLAAANDERFAVEEEIILPDFECGGKCRKYGYRGICKQKYISHNWPLWSAVIIANHPLRHNTHLGKGPKAPI